MFKPYRMNFNYVTRRNFAVKESKGQRIYDY